MAGKGNNKQHEKHQLVLANLLREEDNKFCADCHAKGPRWASWNIGVFMCIRCAGIHRNLGVHISRVKSVNLDSWTPEQIATIQKGGNRIAKEKYEAILPNKFRRPQDDYAVEQFIRSKYERKLYIAKDQPTVVTKKTVTKTTSTKSEPVKNKKSSENNIKQQKKDQLLSVPRPVQSKHSTTPPVMASDTSSHTLTPSPSVPASLTATMATTEPPVDLLTGMTNTSAAQQESPQQPSPQQPSIGNDPQKSVKEGILSLYQTTPTPTHNSPYQQAYTAHGYPVHAYQYQQQQMAAIRMAQQQQQQQHVRAVEEQMRNLKMHQGPHQSSSLLGIGQPFMQPSYQDTSPTPYPQTGGQTLNPHLW